MSTKELKRCGRRTNAKIWKIFTMSTSSSMSYCWLIVWKIFKGIQEYGIDPAHCWTLAGYTWQYCLKMTNLELQLITDLNIYLMFENAIRGGVSTVSNRYSKANNKYISDYDPSQPNLYGYCMSFNYHVVIFDLSTNLINLILRRQTLMAKKVFC